MDILSLEFEYKSKTYRALIRTKILPQEKQYHITVMNGELEKLLYGHHIIREDNGQLQSLLTPDTTVTELKQCIAKALDQHLQERGSLAALHSQMN